ncbi:SRPBCC domain-containing protein [Luteimicrobium sp. DT211]|uniref:SRPBCC domain-containing protein n=1 Tax=Luteimicrobium sp. DT211 TaxID=3393412 RepID=UPI003CE7C4F9
MRHGRLVDLDGRAGVRFSVDVAAPADRLWRAVSDPTDLRTWFPSTVTYRPHVGAPVELTDDPNLPSTAGEVLAYDPPRAFAFTWGDDELWFEVSDAGQSPDGDPLARLVLTDVLDLRDSAARNAAGWEVCLDELEAHLADDDPAGPHTPEARDRWRGYYEEYVSTGMPAGAPIPGEDDDGAPDET